MQGRALLGGSDSNNLAPLHARLQVLQEYLCSYQTASVPVVDLDLANMQRLLDRLHEYLLLCIQMAVG